MWRSQANDAKHYCHLSALVFTCVCAHPWAAGKPSRLHQAKDKPAHGPRCFLTCPQSHLKHVTLVQFFKKRRQCSHNFRLRSNYNYGHEGTVLIHISPLILSGSSDGGQDSGKTAGVEMFVGVLCPVLEAPLKCQLSVWKRDNLADQSGISSFIIHCEPIQSLAAQGHHTLSSMPPLIIRPHQRLFGLSNQCLFNSMPSLQETTNEYFISPLIQS